MSNHLTQVHVPKFVAIASHDLNVAGGAVGYVDTDISAWVPVRAIAVFMSCYSAVANLAAREPGSSADPSANYNGFVLAGMANGHVELYRQAVDNHYILIGYVE